MNGNEETPEVMKYDGLQMKRHERMMKIIGLAKAIEDYELKNGLKTEEDIEQENHELEAEKALEEMGVTLNEERPMNRQQRRRMAKNARKSK